MKALVSLLNQKKSTIENYLAGNMATDKFIQIAIKAISANPKLLSCRPEELYLRIADIAELGLNPTPALGQCYLVPYKDRVSLIIGYKGFISLFARAGVVGIGAEVVLEGEEFSYFPQEEKIHHIIEPDRDYSRKIIGAYSWGKINQTPIVTFMTTGEIIKIRDNSKGFKFAKNREESLWITEFGEMAKKTAIRRLVKRLPYVERILERQEKTIEKVEKIIGGEEFLPSPPELLEDYSEEISSSPSSSDSIE